MKKNLLLLLSSTALLISCGGNSSSSTPAGTSTAPAGTSSSAVTSDEGKGTSEAQPSEDSKGDSRAEPSEDTSIPAGEDSSTPSGDDSSTSQETPEGFVVTLNGAEITVVDVKPAEWSDYIVFDVDLEVEDVLTISLDGEALHFYTWPEPDYTETDLGAEFKAEVEGTYRFGVNSEKKVWFNAPTAPVEPATVTCLVDEVEKEVYNEISEHEGWEGLGYYVVGLKAGQKISFSLDGEALHFYEWPEPDYTETDLGTTYTVAHGGYWGFGINNQKKIWIVAPEEGYSAPEGFSEALTTAATAMMAKENYYARETALLNFTSFMTIDSYDGEKLEQPVDINNNLTVHEGASVDVRTSFDEETLEPSAEAFLDGNYMVFGELNLPFTSYKHDPETGEIYDVVHEIKQAVFDNITGNLYGYLANNNIYLDLTSSHDAFNQIIESIAGLLPEGNAEMLKSSFPGEKIYLPAPEEAASVLASVPSTVGTVFGLASMLFTNNPETGLCAIPANIGNLFDIKGEEGGQWVLNLELNSQSILSLLESFFPDEETITETESFALAEFGDEDPIGLPDEEPEPEMDIASMILPIAKMVLPMLDFECAARLAFDATGRFNFSFDSKAAIKQEYVSTVLSMFNAFASDTLRLALSDLSLFLGISFNLTFDEPTSWTLPDDLDQYTPIETEPVSGGDPIIDGGEF